MAKSLKEPLTPLDSPRVERLPESLAKRLLRAYPRFVQRQGVLRGLLLLVVAATVISAVFASWIAPFSPTEIGLSVLEAPSGEHWFGTDQLGRDVLSRVIHGARPATITALLAVGTGLAIGLPLGLIAGYAGGWGGGAIMRAVDVMLAFPGLLMALLIVTLIGSGLTSIVIAIGVAMIPIFARIVYGATLSIKQRGYVDAARVIGASSTRIVVFHVLPNLASQVGVLATSAFGWAILLAATLNFLGFGLSPPVADWGIDLQFGRQWLQQAWWLAVAPGVAISLTIFATNMLGDTVSGFAAGGAITPDTTGRATVNAAL